MSTLINDTIKAMLENTRDFMFVKDKNLVYVGASENFAVDGALRSGPDDIIGKTDYEVFENVQYAENYRKDDEELLSSGKPKIEYRETYPGKDGETRYCLTSKYLIRDKEGNAAGIFGQCRDITEQVRLEKLDEEQRIALEETIRIAETDALTGLLNRGGSEYRLIREAENGTQGLFCLFNVNNFKHINDRYGHMTGDFVLKKLAEAMKTAFSEEAILSRFGGDEFFIFTSEVHSFDEAKECLERFVRKVEENGHDEIGGEHIFISIGAFFNDGLEPLAFRTVYEKCDMAMYHCKAQTDMPYQMLGTGENAPICGRRTFDYEAKDIVDEEASGDRNILTALSRMYFCSYYIDLTTNSYTIIKPSPNEERFHIRGQTTDEIISEYLRLIVDPEDRGKMEDFMDLRTLNVRMAEEKYIECEYQSSVYHKWCRARFITVRYNTHGALTHVLFLVALLDRNSSQELSEYAYSKKSLEALFNHVPGGVVMYEWNDHHLKTLHISRYYLDQYGESLISEVKNMEGGPDFSRIHPEDIEGFKRAVENAIAETHRFSYEYRVWNRNSKRYEWTEIKAVSEPQMDGTSLIYAIYFDITAQKEAELRLEKSRASLNAALSASNQLSYEYDPLMHTGVCYTDENFFHLPKRIENYPDSLKDIELFHPDDAEKFIETAHRMDTGAKKAQCDVRILKNGEYRWYSCMFDAYEDPEKERQIAILTVVDIADRMTSIQDYNDRVLHLGLIKEESLSCGYINLNQDTYDCICIEDEVAAYLTEGIGFEQLMINTAASVVGEEAQKKYKELFSLKNMMQMAEQGQMRVQMEYLYRYNEKRTQWLEAVVDMVKNPITGEIGGVVYSRSIQKERMASLVLKNTMDPHFSKVAVIMAETDEYFLYDYESGECEESKSDVWDHVYEELRAYSDCLEREKVDKKISKSLVLKHLEEHSEYSFVFDMKIGEELRRAELKFSYMKDTPGLILANIRDITDDTLIKKLRYDSEHDALTGLYHRRYFIEKCELFMQEHQDSNLCMLHIDMKNFHRYNTFFGAEAGDQLLCDIADMLREAGKSYPYWVYGRIDADVFCALLPFNQNIYERHMKAAARFLAGYRNDYLIELKCGLFFIHDKRMPIESMIARASIAAKKVHPNSYLQTEIYNESMERGMTEEQQIMNEMQNALDQKQFQVYLQPKYSLRTNEPVGAEALVRWIHPSKGVIPPGKFIPLFEKNGFIAKLDQYMWEQTAILLRKWKEEGRNVLPVSVNLSRVSIFGPNTVSFLKELVKNYQIETEDLELELTESAYIENTEEIGPRLRELQQFGFKILMDDFGNGYSSLTTLKDLPVDVLKLDMKFLSESEIGNKGYLVLLSVVRMSHLLGLPVIAEGVETKMQAEDLARIGCEAAQGYYFDRPMPVDEYEKRILG